MAIGPQGVVRSELEGGLSGPANPIPNESIDCGCGQMPCPKLARFATRRVLLSLVCTIGIIQGAAQTYFYVTSSTIARRFQINPHVIEWVIIIPDLAAKFFGIPVAYWGDRIHRAAWTGALVMVQGVGYISLIIPHFANNAKIIEESVNVTHMSLYSEDSPDICSPDSSMLIMKEEDSSYVTLGLVITVQVLAGIGNIAYYALMLSYFDDNTKKTQIAIYVGFILSMKFFGVLLGYLLAWVCMMIDAENFNVVESYQEQIGAWWLGWPILGLTLLIPASFVAMFSRRLPSEVVEQAAASILDNANASRSGSIKSYNQKFGSTKLSKSLFRLFGNKIIIFNIFAGMFATMALVNFLAYENIFLESRYYIPRSSGMYLGFGDPWTSRLVARILKPILVGLAAVFAGLIIVKSRPHASYVAGYNVVALAITMTIFIALAFATCEKPSIVGSQRNTITLLKYCNKDCRCSRDADFRPVCDVQGKFTFYSACHAGCTGIEFVNNTKYYQDCSCVEEMLGLGNTVAVDGPCRSSSCRIGWIIFQVSSILISALLASAWVGNILIIFRCIFPQDKALSIGLHMTWICFFMHVPGKMLYEKVANSTCIYWGADEVICHLYDTNKLGDYLCYLSAVITFVGLIFQFFVWVFGKNLKLYGYPELDSSLDTELEKVQTTPLMETEANQSSITVRPADTVDEEPDEKSAGSIEAVATVHPLASPPQNQSLVKEVGQKSAPLKYGPLGEGNSRTNLNISPINEVPNSSNKTAETEDELDSSTDEESDRGKGERNMGIAYRPLELQDSDVESELYSTGPRSRKNVLSKDFDPVLNNLGIASFPAESYQRQSGTSDDEDANSYKERRKSRRSIPNSLSPVQERVKEFESQDNQDDGFSKTDSFEYTPQAQKRPKKLGLDELPKNDPYRLTGDFNEVGIPILDLEKEPRSPTSPVIKIQTIQASQDNFKKHLSRENLDNVPSYKKTEDLGSPESPMNPEQYKLEDVVAEPEVPPLPTSPPPQSSGSSGFGSLLPSDTEEKIGTSVINDDVSRSRENLDRESPATSPSGRKLPTLITDF